MNRTDRLRHLARTLVGTLVVVLVSGCMSIPKPDASSQPPPAAPETAFPQLEPNVSSLQAVYHHLLPLPEVHVDDTVARRAPVPGTTARELPAPHLPVPRPPARSLPQPDEPAASVDATGTDSSTVADATLPSDAALAVPTPPEPATSPEPATRAPSEVAAEPETLSAPVTPSAASPSPAPAPLTEPLTPAEPGTPAEAAPSSEPGTAAEPSPTARPGTPSEPAAAPADPGRSDNAARADEGIVAPTPDTSRPSPSSNHARSDEPAWNERAGRVAAGTEIDIVLPGRGWLYVGKEYADGAISLLEKRTSDGNDVFRFSIGEPGDYGLWFQQQDAVSGTLVNERLALRAEPETTATSLTLSELAAGADPEPRVTDADADPSNETERVTLPYGETTAQDTPVAEEPVVEDVGATVARLLEEGAGVAALRLTVEAVETGESSVDELGDELVQRLVDDMPAEAPAAVLRSFWRNVALSGSSLAPRARRDIFAMARDEESYPDLVDAMTLLREAGEAEPDDLLQVARHAEAQGMHDEALSHYAGALAEGADVDSVLALPEETLFRLAQLLEQPGEGRDLRQASSLYRIIVDDHPLSVHWDESRSRLEYLRRHYFEVR